METPYDSRKGQQTVRNAYDRAGIGSRKKRMRHCNNVDTGLNVTGHESEPTSERSFFAREFGELFLNEEKQMTEMDKIITGASSASALTWKSIDWDHATKEVKQLQIRIAKAVHEKRYGKAKALQWLLTHSFSGKALAVKRVTQNVGSKTPGVDGVIWKTSFQKIQAVLSMQRRGYKPQPLRRIYIPKRLGGHRPLGIPPMICRAWQALHLLAVEPVMETKADRSAYGFRPKRSCADAISQCFITLARKVSASWILEGDIRSCFDNLSGQWLKDHILMDKAILSKWLTAGYIDRKLFHPTFNGVPQGGVISPALLVLGLSGLEDILRSITSPKDKVNLVSYADDFIITGASKETLENKVMPAVAAFLKDRGLELSKEKTKLTHMDDGFDFLGFNVRKYNGKLLIKPAKRNVKDFLNSIRGTIRSNKTIKTEDLIRILNPKIRGWANYYRHAVSKEVFGYVDHCIVKTLMRWVKRRHPEKSSRWRMNKYFRSQGLRRWIFSAPVKKNDGKPAFIDLFSASHLPIRRHIKIRAEANPHDPAYDQYFRDRQRSKNETRLKDQVFLNSKRMETLETHRTAGSHRGL